ncbi:MAG: PorT family protein, partial [Bacteroidia bacterium]|nr:PorT family protein [Bacteroidia bacterium]
MVSFRWKLLLSFYLLTVWYCLPIGSQAQYNTHYDRRKFNLGFTMGVNFADVRIKADDLNYADKKNDGLKDLTVHITPGINLGMITNTKLAKHWDLRFIPSVSLQQRNFDYKFRDSTQQRKLEASYLDLPLHVKFKSDFYKNHRVYLLAGGKFSINLASDKKVRDNPNLLKINR